MRYSIGALSELSGVTIRALHHYDAIGLLHPSETTAAGYRYYDAAAVERLQQILFYRELDIPLHEITALLDAAGFDRARALEEHRALLKKKRERLTRLIELTDRLLGGEQNMSFQEFDTTEIDALKAQYAAEAKERWGDTAAYAESDQRAKARTPQDAAAIEAEANEIFAAFGALVGKAEPADPRVQALVARWQAHITKHHYECTKQILSCLGQMYVCDERFTANIDRHGAGAAQLLSDAIAVYCK